MKTRVLAAGRFGPNGTVQFAISAPSLWEELGDWTLSRFAEANGLLREEKLDWAAGDSGRTGALFVSEAETAPAQLNYPEGARTVRWLGFRDAAKALDDGPSRNFVQLSVQYFVGGGVLDDLAAGVLDEEAKAQWSASQKIPDR